MEIHWKGAGRDINVKGAPPVALVQGKWGRVENLTRWHFLLHMPVRMITSVKLAIILQTKSGLEGQGPTATK